MHVKKLFGLTEMHTHYTHKAKDYKPLGEFTENVKSSHYTGIIKCPCLNLSCVVLVHTC